MMNWSIVKIGAEMFDALHAYGLGILIAGATGKPVALSDGGIAYSLSSYVQARPRAAMSLTDLLGRVLQPPPKNVLMQNLDWEQPSVQLGNLDGLLAVLFTTPGTRVVSVADLLSRQRLRPTAIKDGLEKVNRAIARWQMYAEKQTADSSAWLDEILQDYDATHPQAPLPAHKRARDLSVLMTLDPAFSCSTCRPVSDGLITHKRNVALRGTSYATLLALVGAARFLRAQRVAGKWVNFYMPLPAHAILDSGSMLPLLWPVGYASDQAAAFQWLRYWRLAQSTQMNWQSLAYQAMQTQGAQQSISVSRGCIDYARLDTIESKVGPRLVDHWERLLKRRQEQLPFDIDSLVDCLPSWRAAPWLAHLHTVSLHQHNGSERRIRPYRIDEIKEVTTQMNDTTENPLSAVIEREQGTLRFGHALRLLGKYNRGPLRDIIDTLDSIQTCDQLIRVMAQAVQECAIAGAKTPFIVVPDDEDLRYLLDDVDRYGARTVAELLIILSALRYPCKAEEESPNECEGIPDKLEEGEGDDN